jgi:hypothetical protein
MITYKLQLVQALNCDDKRVHYSFCVSMQQWNNDDDFFNWLVFDNKSTFHLSGKPKGTGAVCAGFTKS